MKCYELGPDDARGYPSRCLLPAGHDASHGWDRPLPRPAFGESEYAYTQRAQQAAGRCPHTDPFICEACGYTYCMACQLCLREGRQHCAACTG